VLLPVDHDPSPGPVLRTIGDFVDLFGKGNVELRLIHAGTDAPIIAPHDVIEGMGQVTLRSGHPVEVIVKEASEWSADLIAMPTAGHVNLGDALSGSTAEQVLRRAPCPVLAVPT